MTDPRETCTNIGELTVGGVRVGLIPCTEPAGHELPVAVIAGDTLPELRVPMAYAVEAGETILATEPGTPHRHTLEWDGADAVDWPEANDPDEPFDVPVELRPDDAREPAGLEWPPPPPELCGERELVEAGKLDGRPAYVKGGGCVYLPHHGDGPHSWEH